MKNRVLIHKLTLDAMFLALIILFSFVPYLGYITLGPISFTTIHLIVLVGAMLFGRKKGAEYGLFMGVMSFFVAFQYPGTINYLFLNPFVSILPRVLFGYLSGLCFDFFRNKLNRQDFMMLSIPLLGILTLLHTVLTLSCLYVFSYIDIFKITALLGFTDIVEANQAVFGSFGTFLIAFVAPGTVCETASSMLIVPLVVAASFSFFYKDSSFAYIVSPFKEESLIKKRTAILLTVIFGLLTIAISALILVLFYI